MKVNLETYLRKLRQKVFVVTEEKAFIIQQRIVRTKQRLKITEGTVNRQAYAKIMYL